MDQAILNTGLKKSNLFYKDPIYHVSILSTSKEELIDQLSEICEKLSNEGDEDKVIETFLPSLYVKIGD